jgi:hypothetical protein
MRFTSIVFTATAAVTASALPQSTPIGDSKFGVVAIQPALPIHNKGIQAAQKSIFVGANSQNATCDSETNTATFHIVDEELFLYTGTATPQRIFVDRSGMGR